MPRIRKRVWIPTAILLIIGSCVLAPQLRYRQHFERDGWVWESSHAWLRCPTCSGRMEKLTFNGQPVPLPRTPVGNFDIFTPVGNACYWDATVGYRPYSWGEIELPESEARISAADLARGYYEVRDRFASTSTQAVRSPDAADGRKQGTPHHWCLGQSDKYQRWLDPSMIDDLDW